MPNINDKIMKIKQKYDIARTTVAVAEEKTKECARQMKELGVTPKTIKKRLKEMKVIVSGYEKKINDMLDDIDERLR